MKGLKYGLWMVLLWTIVCLKLMTLEDLSINLGCNTKQQVIAAKTNSHQLHLLTLDSASWSRGSITLLNEIIGK